MVNSDQEVYDKSNYKKEKDTEAYLTGIKAFGNLKMIQKFCHFILGEKSPLQGTEGTRKFKIDQKCNFEPILRAVMLMFSERREGYKIVLDESDRKLLSFKEILKGVIDPD